MSVRPCVVLLGLALVWLLVAFPSGGEGSIDLDQYTNGSDRDHDDDDNDDIDIDDDDDSDSAYLRAASTLLMRQRQKLLKGLETGGGLGPAVWVGPSPPSDLFGHVQTADPNLANYQPEHLRMRMSRSQSLVSEEVCKTNRYWKLINETFDVYGMQVTVVQTTQMRQFAFVYECISEGRPCSGVAHEVKSACEMRPGWATMLHYHSDGGGGGSDQPVPGHRRRHPASVPQWGYVAVPHHCGCRIYSKIDCENGTKSCS